jgi:hypothetical protein
MHVRKFCLLSIFFGALVLDTNLAWALGLQLGETKEQLKLKYDVAAVDHGTGRVTINLTLVVRRSVFVEHALQILPGLALLLLVALSPLMRQQNRRRSQCH